MGGMGSLKIKYCFDISSREGPVVGNQEAAQIFIKYRYDLVFEISFLDINSQNWNTASYLKSGK